MLLVHYLHNPVCPCGLAPEFPAPGLKAIEAIDKGNGYTNTFAQEVGDVEVLVNLQAYRRAIETVEVEGGVQHHPNQVEGDLVEGVLVKVVQAESLNAREQPRRPGEEDPYSGKGQKGSGCL